VFPVYWQIATSLRSDADLYTPVVNIIPRAWTLDHYYNVLFGARSQFGVQFVNSLIVGIWTTVIAVGFGAMAGYALTRLRFLGRAGLARVLVYSYLAPGTILFIPLYVMANNFNMRDTLTALVLAHLTFSVPFSTWVLMGYFKTIPVELEEAALVDGASRWVLLWRIVMPLAAPAVVVCAVFAFSASWRELLYALVLTQAKDKMTGPIGMTSYVVGDTFYWGQMMAAATLLSIPPLLLYLFGQRWVIQGWTAGAVKS
jgi:multiple sugar transport system permease protein